MTQVNMTLDSLFASTPLLEESSALLKSLRTRARARFDQLGIPSKQDEAYRYLPLHAFYRLPWELARPSTNLCPPQPTTLVFINGYFRPDCSDLTGLPAAVQVMPLEEATTTYRSLLQLRLTASLEAEADSLVALNLALHGQGVFIYIPPACVVPPIECVLMTTESERPSIAFPRMQLFMGIGSVASLNIRSEAISGSACSHLVVDLNLEEGSRFNLERTADLGPSQWHFSALRATLKKNAVLESMSWMSGDKEICTRYSDKVALVGEGAEVQLKGLAVLHNGAEAHAHWTVDHLAPHTRSMQRFKTLLYDTSKASFEGKIIVRPEAQKTEAYQLNNNLLFDDRAIINSKPNLEIFADDVKASHGVTIAQVDPEALFYLKTRGISEAVAKQLLAEAFCQDLIKK